MLFRSDMLERYVTEGTPCPVDVAIIDEAQDLSRLQWRVIKRAFPTAKRVYVGGDDDQAIFRWAGADVDTFLGLKGEKEILSVTHRLPRHIYGYSQIIASRLSRRFEKKAAPRETPGGVHRLATWEQAPVRDGQWMLLSRNSFYLTPLKAWLREEGLPYAQHYGGSVDETHLRAILAWEKLRKGEAVTCAAVREVYDWMPAGPGKKALSAVHADTMLTLADLRGKYGCATEAPWHDALTKIPERDRVYYRAVKRRGESLAKPPRIYIGTIHSVKGGEADNVLLLPDLTQRTWEDSQRTPDDEHRTFYVGATRAKEHLFIVAAGGTRAYDL